uniref:Uncharacterized protein n=1 Tax=Apteryx owenii TaxID=8824 RepID=A0A8B9S6K3_APTOW
MVDTGHSAAGWVMGKSLSSPQECLSHQQVLSTWQQTQKLLSAQEAAHLQGTRCLRKQLSILQSRIQRQASKHNGNPQSGPPLASLEGGCPHGTRQKLGQSMWMGHDIHFVCDIGFWLVGSESHTCRHDYTWSSTHCFSPCIDDCASNPCANSGTCVLGIQSYTCFCPRAGQAPPARPASAAVGALSHQPHCAEGHLGSQRCSCDTEGLDLCSDRATHSVPGPEPWPCSSLLLPDVDECQLFQSSPQTRICLHDCLKLPSSWRVLLLCPPGYVLHTDRNTCDDVNECARNQHKCTRSDLCIDIFGGHRCICPKCPLPRHNTSYVKTSTFQCERKPCPMDSWACHLTATSISFHYLPLQANCTVPHVLLEMSTTCFMGDSLHFAITGIWGQGFFAVWHSDQQMGDLVLTSPVVGPAMLEVELEMSKFSHKVLLGKHIFMVTAFV